MEFNQFEYFLEPLMSNVLISREIAIYGNSIHNLIVTSRIEAIRSTGGKITSKFIVLIFQHNVKIQEALEVNLFISVCPLRCIMYFYDFTFFINYIVL